jgi:hypothetical protein
MKKSMLSVRSLLFFFLIFAIEVSVALASGGSKVVEHSGGWAGYGTDILRVPSRRVTAIVHSNSSNSDVPDIAAEMVKIAGK